MARKRQIDPGFWTNEQVAELPRDARLLFLGMISNADDEGRLHGSPIYLRMAILPGDDVSREQVQGWRDQIVAQGLAQLYRAGDAEYLWLPTWHTHQYISKRQASKIPAPPQTARSPSGDAEGTNGGTSIRHGSTRIDVDQDQAGGGDPQMPASQSSGGTQMELARRTARADADGQQGGEGHSGTVPAPLRHCSAPVVVDFEVGSGSGTKTAVGAPPIPERLRLFLCERGTETTATSVEGHAARLLEKHGDGASAAIGRAYGEAWRQLEGGYGSKVRNLVGWLEKLMEKHVRIVRQERTAG